MLFGMPDIGVESQAQTTTSREEVLRVLMNKDFDSGRLDENQQEALRQLSSKEIFAFFAKLFKAEEMQVKNTEDIIIKGLAAAQTRCSLISCFDVETDKLKLCLLEVLVMSREIYRLLFKLETSESDSAAEARNDLLKLQSSPEAKEAMIEKIEAIVIQAKLAAAEIVDSIQVEIAA